MASFFSFWRNLLRRDRVEQELDDEVRAISNCSSRKRLKPA